MTKPDYALAKAMTAALQAKGIASDMHDSPPNPFWAAQEAFYICQGHRSGKAWRELKQWLTAPGCPPWEYSRKLSEYCHRALQRLDFPENLRDAVADARGYFRAVAESMRRADAGTTNAEGLND